MPVKYDERVKKPLSELEYSYENILELSNCSKDINHFLKYTKIVHPDKGEILFEPYNFQKDLLIKFDKYRFNVALCCRQSGKCVCNTTIIKIRNKKTKLEEEITIEDFLKKIKK